MALRDAVLAALLDSEASGYDLAKGFDASVANFWMATPQQLYRELDRLDHRVLGRAVAEGRPPVIEGIRGAVDDRHDQRAIAGHLATQELAPCGGLHDSQAIGLPQIR